MGEVDASGALVAHYLYVNRPNVPDFMVRKEGSVWNTFRLISDQAGSPKLLVRLTGTTGIVERYDWDDWGVATVTWPGAFHPFGFAGGLWDGDVGNYRFGARAYDAWKGRWWSKDPIGLEGGPNVYAYSNNDPINYVDPTGLTVGVGYDSAGGAGWAAGEEYNAWSIKNSMEVGGLLYEQNGKYYHTRGVYNRLNTNNSGSIRIAAPFVPVGARIVGMWHTHGSFDWMTNGEYCKGDVLKPFSPRGYQGNDNDVALLEKLSLELSTNLVSTVTTPSGHFGIMRNGTSNTATYVYNANFLQSPTSFDAPIEVLYSSPDPFFYTANTGWAP